MAKSSNIWYFLICLFLELFGLFLFIQGFLPIHHSIPGIAHLNNLVENTCLSDFIPKKNLVEILKDGLNVTFLQPQYDRMVIVLVDALRSDFVLSNKSGMPFVHQMVKSKHSLSFVSKAHPPTVTMPRLKALMTGRIPAFSDIILNFDSKELLEDNLLRQYLIAQKSLVFYGDDTWLKLFPGYFKRYEGTTSFMVNDFEEVDNNVTRHLSEELLLSDWDLLILHYLGLDHIGHVAGPNSPLIKNKLVEMDKIVEVIFTKLKQQDEEKHRHSLLVLCGDHGMSNTGSHGGGSVEEIHTPLIFLSSVLINNSDIPVDDEEVYQIDLVPTLALLFGVPIPQNNLGMVLNPFFLHLPAKQILRIFFINALQVATVLKHNNPDWTCDAFGQIIQQHWKWLQQEQNETNIKTLLKSYQKIIIHMRNKISLHLTKYDIYSIVAGIILVAKATILISNVVHYDFTIATFPFKIPYIWFLISVLLCAGHALVCSYEDGSQLCQTNFVSLLQQGTFLLPCCFTWSVLMIIKTHIVRKSYRKVRFFSLSSWFLFLSLMMYIVSLGSSSFVEEEHQTWYFFTSTFHLLLLRELWCVWYNVFYKKRNYIDFEKKHDFTKWSLLMVLLCSGFLRLERMWNQTGYKWLHLSDIGDWLNSLENRTVLSTLLILALLVIFLLRCPYHGYFAKAVLFTALYSVVDHKLGIHITSLVFTTTFRSEWLAWYVYFCAFILLCQSLKKTTKFELLCDLQESIMTICLVLLSLLTKAHNTIFLCMMVVHEQCLAKSLSYLNVHWMIIGYFYMAHTSFFMMGNSNSLSTIDISSGYVGITSYSPFLIGLLITIHTYSGPIFWLVSLWRRLILLYKCEPWPKFKLSFSMVLLNSSWILLFLSSLTLLFYFMVASFNRHHLFVWSVFAPKLLYQGCWTILTAIAAVTMQTVCWGLT